MMMRSPEQFSTLFVFNGNDLRKQALFARLTQASQAQGRAVLWPITRALSEVLEPWRSQATSVVDALIPRILQLSLDDEPEKPAGTEAHSATPPLGLIVLELDDSLPRRLRDAFWPQDASFDQASTVAEPLRMALLSRLNERRESLARRAPLLMVLPKSWTRNAALCAPDLWTVRLTSLYLQPLPPATDAHTETPVPRPLPPAAALETTTGTLTAAHHRILRQWVQAIDTGQTHRMVTSDGWAAVQASLLLGDSTQALLLANAVLELAYQRDNLRDQMVSQNWLGDVYLRLGQLDEALDAYQITHMLAQQLAAGDPNNSDWQRDLSVSYERVAGILEAQGEREQALALYTKSLAIREKLAASDPKNAQWQIDWVVSLIRLARVAPTTVVRNTHYDQALALLQTLDVKGLLSAQQKKWISVIENEKAA